MYSNHVKNEALRLRKRGNSYDFISSKISVAKSTLSVWLKDVSFLPNEMMNNARVRNNKRITKISRVDKAISVMAASNYAKENIKGLNDRDILMFGLGIYLGEGSKTGGVVRIVNSDPRILQFAMIWFKKCFGLTNANFRVRIHLYPDNNEKEVIKFWTRVLGLKRKSFQPSYVDARLNKRKDRRGVLPYGTAHLGIVSNGNKEFGVLLQRKIIASIDLVLDKHKNKRD